MLHLSSGEGLCISTQSPVTCVLCDQEEQDETWTCGPSRPWRGHSSCSIRVTEAEQAVQPQHGSANSTRDRFWHELILPRLDKTLS